MDVAQGGLIFGRRNRGNDCCCESGYGYSGYGGYCAYGGGYRSNGYVYSGPMYTSGYAYSGSMNGGFVNNSMSAYGDPSLGTVQYDAAGSSAVAGNRPVSAFRCRAQWELMD